MCGFKIEIKQDIVAEVGSKALPSNYNAVLVCVLCCMCHEYVIVSTWEDKLSSLYLHRAYAMKLLRLELSAPNCTRERKQ